VEWKKSCEEPMVKRILVYGFPIFIIILEALLRSFVGSESKAFIGPAISAVGVSLLFPIVIPKPISSKIKLSEATRKDVKNKKIIVVAAKDQRIIDLAWLFLLIFTCGWVWTLYLSSIWPGWYWFSIASIQFPGYLIVGFVIYFGGVIFSELKESE
jgi:hypothetical protein